MRSFAFKTILCIILLLSFSCSSDDDEPTEALQPELSVADLVLETTENAEDGSVLGQFAVTQANLTAPLIFELTEVTPIGAVTIDGDGQLLVVDVAAFDFEARRVITGEIEVSSGALSQTVSFTITILDVDEPAVPFVTGWNLQNGELTVRLPLYSGDSQDITDYDFSVDWGDGTEIGLVTSFDDPDATHIYSSAGPKIITIVGTLKGFNFFRNATSRDLIVDVMQWGDMRLGNLGGYFIGCSNLTDFTATDAPILDEVTTMKAMFQGASSFNGDLSRWDVSNIQEMAAMFQGARDFNQDLSSWNVSNVLDMGQMFDSASFFNQDLSSWDVSNVSNMESMFFDAFFFNGDLSDWDVSNVTNMESMFFKARSFNRDLSDWDVSNVTRMDSMFREAESFVGDLSSWEVSNVTRMNDMFLLAIVFNADLSSWDVSNVTDTSGMFFNARAFNANLSNWDVSNVMLMGVMFSGASSFSANLSSWATDNVGVDGCTGFGNGSALTPEQLPTRGPCFQQ